MISAIRRIFLSITIASIATTTIPAFAQTGKIPLPEHPRPDFERKNWINLNGIWNFENDKQNQGENQGWAEGKKLFTQKITVPFPWGSKLSGVKNEADIAWYERSIKVPAEWKDKEVFLIVGASDWITTGWLEGKKVGSYRGGYTPFEFNLTSNVKFGEEQKVRIKVDDKPHDYKLYGKQGYGDAKGIWQTVYLEAREPVALDHVRFSPDIDKQSVTVEAAFNKPTSKSAELILNIKNANIISKQKVAKGQSKLRFSVAIPNAHLWTLEDPHLYEVTVSLSQKGNPADEVSTYFGMRKISVVDLPGTNIPYIALNNKPVYLKLALDQAYHPDGFYTFPSDEFMKEEVALTKRLGLNGQRVHIKVELPRKLYWADKLGVLIMADNPNFWGQPVPEAKKESEFTLREMIERDYNHPSIFSWVTYNETWGLFSKDKNGKNVYLPETQEWVRSMYKLAKNLDPTRLVEDNSPCNYDHVETDINSWHAYLPGYEWKSFLRNVSDKTFPGSTWNFIGGNKQAKTPMINSECGNVWGYEGSTGDVDWTWDYHIMMNEFRSHPKVAGWLYTEHHDVINEWNGYVRFDRSAKITGLDSIMSSMTLNDLHSPVYLAPQLNLCADVDPGARVDVPLWLSVMTDAYKNTPATIETEVLFFDRLGNKRTMGKKTFSGYSINAWESKAVKPIQVELPHEAGLAVLMLRLKENNGKVLQSNFTTFKMGQSTAPRDEKIVVGGERYRVLRFAPQSFTDSKWSQKQWNVLNGLKVNGAGAGYFEYTINIPKDLDLIKVKEATFKFEASAKQLFGKDLNKTASKADLDFMLGGGDHDPSKNPNSYPMTDTKRFPSKVKILINGEEIATATLPDDPADHQGILSWNAQPKDKKLYEAGSYGYLINAMIPASVLANAKGNKLTIQLKVDESLPGGLAIYGENFGRYPIDPMLIFKL